VRVCYLLLFKDDVRWSIDLILPMNLVAFCFIGWLISVAGEEGEGRLRRIARKLVRKCGDGDGDLSLEERINGTTNSLPLGKF
jgi:hypothetical protein